MDITFIISAFDRPNDLNLCLLALKLQTHQNFDVIVNDNHGEQMMNLENRKAIERAGLVQPVMYKNPRLKNCYESSDWAAKFAEGEYLIFPSDDSYFAPTFTEKLLTKARQDDLDFVYCNAMYRRSQMDKRYDGTYWALDSKPEIGWFDKTLFLCRRSKWPGFRSERYRRWDGADGFLAEDVKTFGLKMGKVEEYLCVHN